MRCGLVAFGASFFLACTSHTDAGVGPDASLADARGEVSVDVSELDSGSDDTERTVDSGSSDSGVDEASALNERDGPDVGEAGGEPEPEAGPGDDAGADAPPPDGPSSDAPPLGPCELDMVILLDRSGSMVGYDGFANMGPDLWTPVTAALMQFAGGEDVGVNASLHFFPLPLDAATQILDPNDFRMCEIERYATPAAPLGPLPSNQTAVQDAITNHTPLQGGTPTRPALEGAVQYAENIAERNPSHNVVVVLATDGAPNDCQSDTFSVAAVAEDSLAIGIEVYVISIGTVGGLSHIADVGGTEEAYLVDRDPITIGTQFEAALDAIRTLAACR